MTRRKRSWRSRDYGLADEYTEKSTATTLNKDAFIHWQKYVEEELGPIVYFALEDMGAGPKPEEDNGKETAVKVKIEGEKRGIKESDYIKLIREE